MKNLLPLLILLFSCNNESFREGVFVAGGKYVSARTLNQGKRIYTEYCMACHGEKGDGKGVAAKGMTTPPRDFTSGIIKFGNVLSGDLPHDRSIHKTLVRGLPGTAMLPWDLEPGQMDAVWQYIKTFAPEVWLGKDKKLGETISLAPDPYGIARKSSAIKKGQEVYHIVANCQSCHQAYATKIELSQMSLRINNERISEFEEDLYRAKNQESEHGANTLPPDFTWDPIRSAHTVEEIALRVAAGIGGTTMPAWKDTITDTEIWAVAHYVKHLMDMREAPARDALMNKLRKQ